VGRLTPSLLPPLRFENAGDSKCVAFPAGRGPRTCLLPIQFLFCPDAPPKKKSVYRNSIIISWLQQSRFPPTSLSQYGGRFRFVFRNFKNDPSELICEQILCGRLFSPATPMKIVFPLFQVAPLQSLPFKGSYCSSSLWRLTFSLGFVPWFRNRSESFCQEASQSGLIFDAAGLRPPFSLDLSWRAVPSL